jgi:serine/threonine protein kinase
MPRDADPSPDLLFGLMALQNGLIEQGALVAAFRAWTHARAQPLGPVPALAELLVRQGALDARDRELLEAMVARHVERHGGSAEASLAGVTVPPALRASLDGLGDRQVEATLAHVGSRGTGSTEPGSDGDGDADGPAGDPGRTTTFRVSTAGADGQRFRVLRPHARGGLGEVFVALDGELHREVALKQIQERLADDPVSRARFLVEAEVTGGLEHPGIVPVYGLGSDQSGRPYYAMRFIRGDSLKEAADRFHGDAERHARPSARALAMRQLLRRFLDVCNAVDYAHGRGVLHRDLKPGNVIVGKHGETLVVDWGLAKLIGRAEPGATDERPLTLASASGTAETLPGSALGTPAYMSPEQARGDLDSLGPATDVYSLGATLYYLLTGRPPFDEKNLGDLLRAVERGDFPRPRQLDPGIPRALDAICVKAMATRPEDRYRTAKALADDVERWMAGAPVAAYPREEWIDQLTRWARRNQSGALAIGLTLVGVALAALISAVSIDRARRAAEAAETLARKREFEAGDNLRVARENLRLAQDVTRGALHRVASSALAQVPGAGLVRRELARSALDFNERFLKIDPKNLDVQWDVIDIYRTVGRLFSQAGEPTPAMEHFQRAFTLGRAMCTDPRSLSTVFAARRIEMLAKTCLDLSMLLRNRGRYAEARPYIEEGRKAAAEALRQFQRTPREYQESQKRGTDYSFELTIARLDSEAARIDLDEGRYPEALSGYEKVAAALRTSLLGVTTPKDAIPIVRDDPGGNRAGEIGALGWAERGHALALHGLGRDTEALAALDEAGRWLAGHDAVDLRAALVEVERARALVAPDAAARREAIDRAVALAGRLARESAEVRSYVQLLAAARVQRGAARAAAGEPGPAREDLEAARDAIAPLLKVSDPDGRPAVPDLAVAAEALAGLADLARAGGDAAGARALDEQAAARLDEALAICPEHAACRRQREAVATRLGTAAAPPVTPPGR